MSRGSRASDSLPFETAGGFDDVEWEVFGEPRPPRRGGPWLWVAGLGLAAALGAAAVFARTGDDPSSAPPTSGAPTPSQSAVVSPSTGPVARATSTFPALPFRTFGTGPVLGTEVGTRLVGVTRREAAWWLVDVDLDTGNTIQTPLPVLAEADVPPSGLLPLTDATVVWGTRGRALLVDPDRGWRPILDESYGSIQPGPDGQSLWWLDYLSAGVPVLRQSRMVDDRTLVALSLAGKVVGPDGAGGVLVTAAGQLTSRVTPGGDVESLPILRGAVIAAGPSVLVERPCGAGVDCSLVAHRFESTSVTLDLPPGAGLRRSALSPDGKYLAVFVQIPDSTLAELRLVDLATGTSRAVGEGASDQDAGRLDWVGPDVLVFSEGRGLRSLRVGTGDAAPAAVTLDGEPLAFETFAVVPST